MQMHAGMAHQPSVNERRFMGAGIVQHQVQVQPGRCGALHRRQKVAEIDAAVAPVHLADDCACPHIERGEQIRGAVANVVVRVALELARAHWQYRGRAFKRLNGGLLVDAQHERSVGRIKVQPDDVANLVSEMRIGRKLERLTAVRRERKSSPDARDGCLAHAQLPV